MRTKKLHSEEVFSFDKTLMSAIKEGDITGIETQIMDNLFLLPSYIDFANYVTFLQLQYGLVEEDDPEYENIYKNQIAHFDNLLASDYVLIVLQTQELSLDGATEYLKDLQKIATKYNGAFEIVGVLPVLMDGNASLDKFVLSNAESVFGEGNIFENKIPNMARLKRFDNTGITEFDRHDKKVNDLYDLVSDELLERIKYFEKGDQ